MIILLGLFGVLMCSLLLTKGARSCGAREMVGQLGIIFSSLLLFVCLLSLLISRSTDTSNIQRYKAFCRTLQTARIRGDTTEIERASIQSDISKWNEWIASSKYWNDTILDIWTVDEVANLKEIE